MGEVLARGLLRAGWDAQDLVLAARRPERARQAEHDTGVTTLLEPAEATRGRDVVVVAVKPRDVAVLLQQIGETVTTDQVVVSLAAGVPVAVYEAALSPGVAVVRAMPNTPAAVDEAMTAFCPGTAAGEDALAKAEKVLTAVGPTIRLAEDLLDAVTAVSGTGPAYVFLLAEAMIEAAVREGLPLYAASKLVGQTLKGAGILLESSDHTPFELRAQVTSPGGTTAAAVHVLEEGGFRAVLENAIRAAAQRSREMGERAREGS